jgi:hypothetical protein
MESLDGPICPGSWPTLKSVEGFWIALDKNEGHPGKEKSKIILLQ